MVQITGHGIQQLFKAHKQNKRIVSDRCASAEETLAYLQGEFSKVGRSLDEEDFLEATINGAGTKVTVKSVGTASLVLETHESGLIKVERRLGNGDEFTTLAQLDPIDLENQAEAILEDFLDWAVKRLPINVAPLPYTKQDETQDEGWMNKVSASSLRPQG